MHIIMLVQKFYPYVGGVEKHVLNLGRELIDEGHKVIIITYNNGNLPEYDEIDNIQIHRINCKKQKILYSYIWVIKNINLFWCSTIIHCHDYSVFLGIYLPLRILLFWKRVYITFHGWEGDFPPKRRTIFYRKLVEHLTRGNICIGDYIEKWYKTKADKIIYGATNIPINEVTIEKKQFIYVGRLEKDTGIIEYFKAYQILITTYNIYIPFVVCGEGSLLEYLQKVSNDNMLNIQFMGSISDPISIIKVSKYCLTSGYLSMLDAMINKKIVISTYNNKLKEDYLKMIPNYDEKIILSDDPIELASKINEIIMNDEVFKEKVEKSFKWAAGLTWKNMMIEYLDLWGVK